MKRKIELLAPGGDIDSIKAAIVAGANAIYCGLDRFNARTRAENITFENLKGILRLAHSHDCEVFLTLNVIIIESEIPAFVGLLNRLSNTKIDGVIVQDLGMFYLLSKYFTGLKIHASTQCTTHNEGQIKFLSKLGATRVNLSRELSLSEIKSLTVVAHENSLLTEVFVHGSYCISFSGICYLSSVIGGKSGNRGRCSQPCRDQYVTTTEGKNFPLNLKDNSAFSDLMLLSDVGVDSVKIEGRMKKFHYVYTVVNAWKKQLQRLYDHYPLQSDDSDLYKVFNRDFSNSFLKGEINKSMFIDNSRDNSARHLAKLNGGCTDDNIKGAKRELYDLKTKIRDDVKEQIASLSIAKAPLEIAVSGKSGAPLKVYVKTPETSFVVCSSVDLVDTGTSQKSDNQAPKNEKNSTQFLTDEIFLNRFKAINDTEYFINYIEIDNLQQDLFIPFKEITSIKKKILFILNGSKEAVAPVVLLDNTTEDIPLVKKRSRERIIPTLSLLISSQNDLQLCHDIMAHSNNAASVNTYFQLPSNLKNRCSEFIDFFLKNNIFPWFPSVLMGENYCAAIEFLQEVQPKRIVTNNTGIAYEAYQNGIPWVAGPYLNIVNSLSLICLKENFNCYGSFISNEIRKEQIKAIKKPVDFSLYYSIYHPLVLLTSRQCLFHPVIGCKKNKIDESCIQQCEKSAEIINLHNRSLFIAKTEGNYHKVYNEINFLNTDIVTDVQDLFASFFIDLREIQTKTTMEVDKLTIITLFINLLNGKIDSAEKLKQSIRPTTNGQYIKGI